MSINKRLNEQYFETRRKHRKIYGKKLSRKEGILKAILLIVLILVMKYIKSRGEDQQATNPEYNIEINSNNNE